MTGLLPCLRSRLFCGGLACAALLLSGAASLAADAKRIDVRDYGASPDGETLCTAAIQSAIDRCAAEGGGTVRLPQGIWLTGTVYLRSHVTLELLKDCVLRGSKNRSDYGGPPAAGGKDADPSFRSNAILAGKGLQRVAIRGEGLIDGQGASFRDKTKMRPKCVYLESCTDVSIEGIRMQAAGSWMQHYRDCERLTIRNIQVFNHVSFNNDGLNIDSCRNVSITGCRVDSDDDGIVLKSLSLKPCENVTIRDCTVSSHCNALKLGTESGGGFRNIVIEDCTVHSPRESQVIYGRQRGLAGLALEIVDGGILEDVSISRVTIDGVTAPIFLRLGNRARSYAPDHKPGIGTFRRVRIEQVTATNCSPLGCSITGLPDHPIEDVRLKSISLHFEGGGARELAHRSIPERPEAYPESTMFGDLPAWGFFCRHVKGLSLSDVRLRTEQKDMRHVLVCDDVENLQLENFRATSSTDAAAPIRLTNVRGAALDNCVFEPPATLMLRLEGAATNRIQISGSDLPATTLADVAAEVSAGELRVKP